MLQPPSSSFVCADQTAPPDHLPDLDPGRGTPQNSNLNLRQRLLIPTNPQDMPSSILKDGKLKPGIYQIQNLVGQTFVEMQESARQLCCRPSTALSNGGGLVRSLGFDLAKLPVPDSMCDASPMTLMACSGISSPSVPVTSSER
jgi:hypothetical protein